MKKLTRFFIMLGCALATALGLLGAAVWGIGGAVGFLYGGLALAAVGIALLAVCGRRTRKSEARTHGLARVCRTAVVITLAACAVLIPAKGMLDRVNGNPIPASYLLGGDDVVLVGHRGFSALCPQNTLPAFNLAAQLGMDGYEFDVHTSKDGVWVVNHDDTVDAMTDGSGRIADYTYDELLGFTVDGGNNVAAFGDGLRLPTLEQALDVCAGKEIFPVIEIKDCDPARFPQLLQAVYDRGLRDKALVISFNMDYLEQIRALDPEIRLSFLSNRLTKEDVDKCAALGNTGVDVNVGNALKMGKALRYAKAQGMDMIGWTVDLPAMAALARFYGIRTLTTNRIGPANVTFNGRLPADS